MTEPVPIELVMGIVAVTTAPSAGDTSIADTSALTEPVAIEVVVATVAVTTLRSRGDSPSAAERPMDERMPRDWRRSR